MDMICNVAVAVRVRPPSSSSLNKLGKAKMVVTVGDGETSTTIEHPNGSFQPKTFTFDHAYDRHAGQDRIYDDLARPIVDKAFEGYNGTIFAYGQTGSGKTYTMLGGGDDETFGITPRVNRDLFERIRRSTNAKVKYLVTVSYLEIYNEVVKDLLNPSERKVLKIREHPDMGIYVEGLAEIVVKSAEDLRKLLARGNKIRKVAETTMNLRSSRSHTCFTIRIEQKKSERVGDVEKQRSLTSKINLVDLAGSERVAKTGAVGERLKEGAMINKSLSCLGNVINALSKTQQQMTISSYPTITKTANTPSKTATTTMMMTTNDVFDASLSQGTTHNTIVSHQHQHSRHIPYRDSKLTRLLQESLGGNSLTAMIATISPSPENYNETLSTLKYANRAKNIRNEAKVNEDVNARIIRKLRLEITKLKSQLAAIVDSQDDDDRNNEMTIRDMEQQIAHLERAQHQTWTEKERLSELYENERRRNSNEHVEIEELYQKYRRILDIINALRKERAELLRETEQDANLLRPEDRRRQRRLLQSMSVRLSDAYAEAAAHGMFLAGGEDSSRSSSRSSKSGEEEDSSSMILTLPSEIREECERIRSEGGDRMSQIKRRRESIAAKMIMSTTTNEDRTRLNHENDLILLQSDLVSQRASKRCLEIERNAYRSMCKHVNVLWREDKKRDRSMREREKEDKSGYGDENCVKRLCVRVIQEKEALGRTCSAMTQQLQFSLKRVLDLQRRNKELETMLYGHRHHHHANDTVMETKNAWG